MDVLQTFQNPSLSSSPAMHPLVNGPPAHIPNITRWFTLSVALNFPVFLIPSHLSKYVECDSSMSLQAPESKDLITSILSTLQAAEGSS